MFDDTEEAIAKRYGVTESRACQLVKESVVALRSALGVDDTATERKRRR
jgi:DNA-directed RNA polymerase specialized sigma subunit